MISKLNLFGLVLFTAACLSVRADDKPVGVVIDTQVQEDEVLVDVKGEDFVKPHFKIIRDGVEIPVEGLVSGMAVFADDIILTEKEGGAAILFAPTEATTTPQAATSVTLQASTQLTVAGVGGGFDTPSFVLNSGHVMVSVNSREAGMAFGVGSSRTPVARASNTVKMSIYVTSPAAGAFQTHVGVTSGTVALTPKAGTASTDITAGTSAVMTINTALHTDTVVGTVNPGNISKDALKVLKGGIKTGVTVSETLVAQSKSGFTFKATINNGDGSVSKGSVTTTLTGAVGKDAWKTTNKADKSSLSWAQDNGKATIKFASKFAGNSFSASFVGNNASKAQLKGSNKQTYKGTAVYNPATGLITFTTTAPGKDGSTATYTYDPRDPSKAVETIVVTAGGVAGTPITHSLVTKAPPANVPSGALISQNMPPKSQ